MKNNNSKYIISLIALLIFGLIIILININTITKKTVNTEVFEETKYRISINDKQALVLYDKNNNNVYICFNYIISPLYDENGDIMKYDYYLENYINK